MARISPSEANAFTKSARGELPIGIAIEPIIEARAEEGRLSKSRSNAEPRL
jgi:hypothetical protein